MLSRLRRYHTAPASSVETQHQDPLEALRALIGPHTTPDNEAFLTEACLTRYLVARSNDPDKAYKQLQTTLSWRASYKPDALYADHTDGIRHAAETGKMFVLPRPDRHGRAVIVMRPGLENSPDAVMNVRYLVYTLERAAALAEKEGDGRFVVIVDFFSGKISVSTSPGVSVMRETTGILQGHYPERLGGMVFFEAPRFFHGLFKLVRPFIDPITREKIHFVKRGVALPDVECLDAAAVPKDYGGTLEFEFELDKYFASEE